MILVAITVWVHSRIEEFAPAIFGTIRRKRKSCKIFTAKEKEVFEKPESPVMKSCRVPISLLLLS